MGWGPGTCPADRLVTGWIWPGKTATRKPVTHTRFLAAPNTASKRLKDAAARKGTPGENRSKRRTQRLALNRSGRAEVLVSAVVETFWQ